MEETALYPGGVLALPGHDYPSPNAARTAAADWLTGHDVSAWDAALHTETAAVGRAWLCDVDCGEPDMPPGPHGFVQPAHAAAEPVTVVQLPAGLLPDPA